jgi:hypothetical protein
MWMVDRALRRSMFILRGFAAIIWHRATKRAIHPLSFLRPATPAAYCAKPYAIISSQSRSHARGRVTYLLLLL